MHKRESAKNNNSGFKRNENASGSLKMLSEMFPDWNTDDLLALLADVNEDLELAVNRIASGHAQQWTAAGKKPIPKQEPTKSFKGKNFSSKKSRAHDNFSTSNTFKPAEISSLSRQPEAELTWSTGAAPESLAWQTSVEVAKEYDAPLIQESIVIESSTVVEEPEIVPFEAIQAVAEIKSEAVVAVEDEDVVKIPKMPARRQPALEIEPSPVLLPIKVPIKMGSNITFGSSASSPSANSSENNNRIVFGETKPSTKSFSSEEFFMRAASSSYTTTGVDAAASTAATNIPPGFTSSPVSHEGQFNTKNQQDFDRFDSNNRRQPSSNYYNNRQYDSYVAGQASQQRYDQTSYNQRYTPYVTAQPGLEDPFASSYYGNTSRGSQNAVAPGFYPYPHMMYGNDPYTAAAAAAAFTHSTQRYQPSHNYSSPSSGYASASNPNPYSVPGNSAVGTNHQQYSPQGTSGNRKNTRIF